MVTMNTMLGEIMSDSLSTLKEMSQSQLFLTLTVFSGLVASGAMLLWVFIPAVIYDQSVSKIILLSLTISAPFTFLNFIILSVVGASSGAPRSEPNLFAEFTLSAASVVLSCIVAVAIALLWERHLIICGSVAFSANIAVMWFLVTMRKIT